MSRSKQQSRRLRPLYQDPAALRRKRIEAGLDQADLAGRADCSQNFISNLERGNRSASAPMLGKLAQALGCEIADLLPPLANGNGGCAA